MSWNSNVAACGTLDQSFTANGSSDVDYIAYSILSDYGGDVTFDLTNLANRDISSYLLEVTLKLELQYTGIHANGIEDYTFIVREHDCRP